MTFRKYVKPTQLAFLFLVLCPLDFPIGLAAPHPPFCPKMEDGLLVADGFEILEVAGPELADDIYSMTVSDRGEVFVSSRGYIRRLVDDDGDGQFDRAVDFAKMPRNGAQGMLAVKDKLYCTGDEGLLEFTDRNRDGVADGAPQCLQPLKTGAEHGSHAIRIGPDGWLYVLCGNATPIEPNFYSDPNSPVKNPHAGFLLRIHPDGEQKQIVADGFRNAYDFDFNSAGEIFVYDSDGERDISLPWYRPTRVYRIRAGDNAGWMGVGWKRPRSYFDMPATIASLGRGSPTGVEVYHSSPDDSPRSLGSRLHDAVIVGDWTFGRVVAIQRDVQKVNGRWDVQYSEPFTLAESTGSFGFAVTDIARDADGTLLVSVGGRGTRGAVYRISRTADQAQESATATDNDASAWLIKQSDLAQKIRQRSEESNVALLKQFAATNLSTVVKEALLESMEAISPQQWGKTNVESEVLSNVGDRFCEVIDSQDLPAIGLVYRTLQCLPQKWRKSFLSEPRSMDCELLIELAIAELPEQRFSVLLKTLDQLQTANADDPTRRDFLLRLGQLCLGGCTDQPSNPMFHGYEARKPIELTRSMIEDVVPKLSDIAVRWSEEIKNSNRQLTLKTTAGLQLAELGRLMALACPNSEQLGRVAVIALELHDAPSKQSPPPKLSIDSSPVIGSRKQLEKEAAINGSVESLIHWLNVASVNQKLSFSRTSAISKSIVSIDGRLRKANQAVDRNFEPRLIATIKKLIDTNKPLENELSNQYEGNPNQWYIFASLKKTGQDRARSKLAIHALDHPDEVSARTIKALSAQPRYKPWIRGLKKRSDLQFAIVEALHQSPIEEDAQLMLDALQNSSRPDTIKHAGIAIRRLFEGKSVPKEITASTLCIAAIFAEQRLGWGRADVSARDQLVLLLRSLSDKQFGYQLKLYQLNAGQKPRQIKSIASFNRWANEQFPQAYDAAAKPTEPTELDGRLKGLNFAEANLENGKLVYQKLRCAACHEAGNRLGPRLDGIGKRFSRTDLIRSIAYPNEQVPDRFQTTVIATFDGNIVTGSIVYDSIAGVVLQTADGMTATVRADDIEDRKTMKKSLMPEGLLDTISDQDCVDLIKYLETK